MSTQFVAFQLLQNNVAVKFSLSQQSVLCCMFAACGRADDKRLRKPSADKGYQLSSCDTILQFLASNLCQGGGLLILNGVILHFSLERLCKIYLIFIVNVRLSCRLSSIYHALGLDSAERIQLFQRRCAFILTFNY